jgi:hypothetical protein
MRFHINVPEPIRKIEITGGEYLGPRLVEYEEEELVTETIIEGEAQDEITSVMPQGLECHVYCYDGTTYHKGYMENDTVKGNIYDHDRYLDRIGAILGISRRIYKNEFITAMGDHLKWRYITPPYWNKYRHTTTSWVTEDDYDYYKRLKYFIDQYGSVPLPLLMADVIFEYGSLQSPIQTTMTREYYRNTQMQQQQNVPVLIVPQNNSKYMNIDYTNAEDVITHYANITRGALLYNPTPKSLTVEDQEWGIYSPNSGELKLENIQAEWEETVYTPTTEDTIYYYEDYYQIPLQVSIEYPEKQKTMTQNIIIAGPEGVRVPLTGVPGDTRIIAKYTFPEYYDFIGYTEMMSDQYQTSALILDADHFTSPNYGTITAGIVQPSYNSSMGGWNVGRNVLWNTPILNPELVDLDDIRVSATIRYTQNYQRIGVCRIRPRGTGMEVSTAWIIPYDTDPTGAGGNSTFEAVIEDNTLQYYINGIDTGVSVDLDDGNKEMLYLCMYNPRPTGSGQDMYIIDANCSYDSSSRQRVTLGFSLVDDTEGSAEALVSLITTSTSTPVSGAVVKVYEINVLIGTTTTSSTGEGTISLGALVAGTHTLRIEYEGDTTYVPATQNETVVIQEVSTDVIADISTSSTEWTVTPQQDGVHATGSYQAWKTQIPPNTTLRITANISGSVEYDLKDTITGNHSSLTFKNNEITKWGQIGSGRLSTDGIPTGTGVIVELTNNGNGEFLYNYSDGTSGTIQLNSNKLDNYYFTFKNNGSGEVVITDLRYHPNS